jgi:GntR family transcriptional regulator / MocR family aminotransferase
MARQPAGALLNVVLDARSKTPLHRQIYDGVRHAILSGRLAAGTRLASTRSTAADLDVSRTTVTSAFAQLMAEGYVVGRIGSGTRVSNALPEKTISTRAARVGSPGSGARPTFSSHSRLYGSGLRAPLPPVRPFWPGNPSVEAFPVREWARLVARQWRSTAACQLQYGDPLGDAALRTAIAAYVARARGVRCEREQVMIVSGAQQAFFLCAQLLLDSDDAVWMEEPGYPFARLALQSTGARMVPVPVDADGLNVMSGRTLEPKPKLVYVTPSHQCPLGVAMSVARRLELLQFVDNANAWVIEDDYDSEYRYRSRPLPALQSLDRDGRVIYVGSFSKTLLPCLRLGFLVLPRRLTEMFARARAVIDRHPPTVEQAVLAAFINEGAFDRHVRRMRAMYLERRDVLMKALRDQMRNDIQVAARDAGLYVVAWLQHGLAEKAIVAATAARGVDTLPVSTFYQRPPDRVGLVLGYGGYSPEAIRQGVQRLSDAVREVTAARGEGKRARTSAIT